MCKFFSCISNGNGNIMYLNSAQRKEVKDKYESFDSHTSIADYYGYKGKAEDVLNKYEFNPLTKKFRVDQINTTDDRDLILSQCLALDFKTIVPELIIKPIIHPFKDRQCSIVTEEDIILLKQWASVEASLEDSMLNSLEDSMLNSIRYLIENSVWDSIEASLEDPVWDSIRYLIENSVWDSVWASIGASVRAYASSFFDIKYYREDYSPCTKLWEKGLVPLFDSKTWRLHGKDGKVLWEDYSPCTKLDEATK